MKAFEEILMDYTRGKRTLPETNRALAELDGNELLLDPERNVITEEEKRATTVGYYPDQANGYGLMDHGMGCMEKVHIVDGHCVSCNMGQEYAEVYIAGRKYRLRGDLLTEED